MGTLIILVLNLHPYQTTPLTRRKWVRSEMRTWGTFNYVMKTVLFSAIERVEESPTYAADETILFYDQVASGTVSIGFRVEE